MKTVNAHVNSVFKNTFYGTSCNHIFRRHTTRYTIITTPSSADLDIWQNWVVKNINCWKINCWDINCWIQPSFPFVSVLVLNLLEPLERLPHKSVLKKRFNFVQIEPEIKVEWVCDVNARIWGRWVLIVMMMIRRRRLKVIMCWVDKCHFIDIIAESWRWLDWNGMQTYVGF